MSGLFATLGHLHRELIYEMINRLALTGGCCDTFHILGFPRNQRAEKKVLTIVYMNGSTNGYYQQETSSSVRMDSATSMYPSAGCTYQMVGFPMASIIFLWMVGGTPGMDNPTQLYSTCLVISQFLCPVHPGIGIFLGFFEGIS